MPISSHFKSSMKEKPAAGCRLTGGQESRRAGEQAARQAAQTYRNRGRQTEEALLLPIAEKEPPAAAC
jgi:hypothetical protein